MSGIIVTSVAIVDLSLERLTYPLNGSCPLNGSGLWGSQPYRLALPGSSGVAE